VTYLQLNCSQTAFSICGLLLVLAVILWKVTVTQSMLQRCLGVAEVQQHFFLTLALDIGEWSTSWTGCFSVRERIANTLWIGSWVGPRAGQDILERRKISCSCKHLNPGSSNQ